MADGSQQAPKRSKLEYKDTFTVLVGPEKESFVLHASIATTHSKFFQAACRGKFKEAKEKVVRLLEVSEETFRAYVQWMYSGTVVVMDKQEHEADADCCVHEVNLVKLYILADTLAALPLRNKTIDEYVVFSRSPSSGTVSLCIKLAYKHTPVGSRLRELFVDENVYWSAYWTKWLKRQLHHLPVEFISDLAIGMAERGWVRPTDPCMREKCAYHEHDEEFPACSD
ncbi:hypothetical protein B0A55_03559 [Friedmanniomyces simplex]|uniref:BTB domain-containing protein n=1 Tax=Friedmanniomyces simplex TaxID=329884 RepID=A0A4U0XV46_9PEZI|nr:hypothetical protein B0A55_03559 [Friedmanniomyces simplex]